jgi:hypothetical protein
MGDAVDGVGGMAASDADLPAVIRFEGNDRCAYEARRETDRVLVAPVGARVGRLAVRTAFELSASDLRAAEQRAACRG